jgi:Holliday junction resolvase RusA-like endonuclease
LNAWKAQVRGEVASHWTEPALGGDVRLRVTYYSERAAIDGDNLLKPIQDALQGVVYANDRQVIQAEVRHLDIDDPVRVRYMPSALALAFSDGRPFVHVEVWPNPDRERIL